MCELRLQYFRNMNIYNRQCVCLCWCVRVLVVWVCVNIRIPLRHDFGPIDILHSCDSFVFIINAETFTQWWWWMTNLLSSPETLTPSITYFYRKTKYKIQAAKECLSTFLTRFFLNTSLFGKIICKHIFTKTVYFYYSFLE